MAKRNNSRRSFTVEIKSTDRRHATIIPSRIAAPAAPTPRAFQAAPAAPVAETKRRILPSLIVPEVEPEPMLMPVRRRGRPPKPRPVAVIEAIPPIPTPRPVSAPMPPQRPVRRTPALAPGERWKRRLGRWSR